MIMVPRMNIPLVISGDPSNESTEKDSGVMNKHVTLDSLFSDGLIHLHRGALCDRQLEPKPAYFSFSNIEGMLLGVAIGDSLGNSTESMFPSKRATLYGEITDYLSTDFSSEPKGFPSDDTQLTFWTLEELLQNDGLNPEELAARFAGERIYGIGSTVKRFISNFKAGNPWEQCGPDSAGNGSLMRISPVILPYLKRGGSGAMADTALCAMITHNNDLSISACLLHNYILWQLLDMTANPDAEWWISQIDNAKDLMTGRKYSVRGGINAEMAVQPWGYIQGMLRLALDENWSVRKACDTWWSGAYLLETIPCVFYIMMMHGHEPETAIIRAVNDTKDNDTIASIVGSLVGALYGKDAFPRRWIEGLTGRTRSDDDGRVFELIRMSREKWWS